MKFNFKRIASVLATTVMLGSTVSFAAAAWPAPFVNSGAANSAVVVGAAAVGATDMAAATQIADALNAGVTATGSGEVSGEGDKYLLEKTSTKFHLGDVVTNVVSATVDSEDLPTLLADGKFLDSDNNEYDYTQKITLAGWSTSMFEDNDYKEDVPTVGVKVASGSTLLTYTLELTDQPDQTKLETTDVNILGKEYYVLDFTNSSLTAGKLTLLDSAEKVVLADGESKTVVIGDKSYDVSIAFIGSNEVKLNVNGQTTNSLTEQQTFKLSDGSYIGIRDISVQDYAGGAKQVEFGLGSGKLILTDGSDIELNDDSVARVNASVVLSSGKLASVSIGWAADGDQFIAPGSEPVIPGFSNIKLIWDGFNAPTSEAITATYGGDDYVILDNFPLKDSTEDINLVYSTNNVNFTGIGKDASSVLATSGTSTLTFDADTDDYFIVSWKDSGNKDVESYLMRATSFKREDGINKTTVEYKKDGVWSVVKSDRKIGDTISIGNVELTLNDTSYGGKNATFTYTGTAHSFNTLYSKEGLKVQLPWTNSTVNSIAGLNTTPTQGNCTASAVWKPGQLSSVIGNSSGSAGVTCLATTWKLQMNEEDKDDTIAGGAQFNVTFGFNSATAPQVSVTAVTGANGTDTEVGTTDVMKNYIYSALATSYMWDKGGDQDKVTITYNGGETMAKIYLASPTVTSTDAANVKVVKDTEIDSVKDKNLVVVGGSCINTVAAKLLGSDAPVCGSAFSSKTTVGAGQYLIQVLASPYNAQKVAMLVAGYEAAETTAAAAKVKEGTTSTDVGTKIVGPTAA